MRFNKGEFFAYCPVGLYERIYYVTAVDRYIVIMDRTSQGWTMDSYPYDPMDDDTPVCISHILCNDNFITKGHKKYVVLLLQQLLEKNNEIG